MDEIPAKPAVIGVLSAAAGKAFLLAVCNSAAGYYLGKYDGTGAPFSRQSLQYWPTAAQAQVALTGVPRPNHRKFPPGGPWGLNAPAYRTPLPSGVVSADLRFFRGTGFARVFNVLPPKAAELDEKTEESHRQLP